ncbi:Hypothetical predicted protein [Mytilus galloprovincialis]|uniref:Reverse transcriptase RNase H-like domain-containing protein n=1 Tax=Mytilus galloprovincialis TaxID=29158 RepID=A0A8B6FZF6_MYTGA|nr:Hypothetical predicted protein [Mytilus galloprovincialis]
MRPVLDLSVLNQYLVVPHFKMETNRSIRSTIHLGIWTTSLDLMDAYFHIPISHKFRHFLRLVWADKVYSFKVQGYAFWPGYCTPSFYQDFSDGAVLSSYSGSTRLLLPRRFSYQESLPISFEGTHQFVYPFTPETGFFDFMEKIRDNSQSEFQFPGRTFSDRFGSSASSRREGNQGSFVGSSRPQPNFVHRCEADGLGSLSGGQDSFGPLVRLEEHINLLEMRAVFLSLRQFQAVIQGQSLLVATDNSTVVAYLQNQGGNHSFSLYHLSKEVLLLCHSLDIILSVRHVPGSQNLLADDLSRSRVPVNTEWEIHPSVFQEIILRWDRPHIDLLATSLNHKLKTYASPIPDEKAWAVDAITLSWKGIFSYMFPPFRLLPKILHKIQRDLWKIILIAPAWPRPFWYPELLLLCCAKPLRLPLREDLLSQF